MTRRTRPLLLVPLAAAALAVAGCSTSIPGTAYPQGAGPAPEPAAAPAGTDDPVAWVDQVCGSLVPALRASTKPTNADYTDLDKAADALDQHLREISDAAGEGLAVLDGLGPSPTPHGDEFVAQYRSSLTTLQKLGADPAPGTGAAAPEPVNPYQVFAEDPELAAAAAEAPNCITPLGQPGQTH